MADLSHVSPNRLLKKSKIQRWTATAIALSAVGLVSLAVPAAILLAFPAWWATRRVGGLARSGADGEGAALDEISRLPNSHVVFNQVRIPCPEARHGYLEADYVVVGPERIAVVEIKNYRGCITGRPSDAQWLVNGRLLRNPVRQVARHVAVLGPWLRGHGAPGVWLEPAIYFPHATATFSGARDTSSAGVSIVEPGKLQAYFAFRQPNDRPFDRAAVIAALDKLRSWEPGRPLPVPSVRSPAPTHQVRNSVPAKPSAVHVDAFGPPTPRNTRPVRP